MNLHTRVLSGRFTPPRQSRHPTDHACACHEYSLVASPPNSLSPLAAAANTRLPARHCAAARRKGLVPARRVVGATGPLQHVARGGHAHHARQRASRVADAPGGRAGRRAGSGGRRVGGAGRRCSRNGDAPAHSTVHSAQHAWGAVDASAHCSSEHRSRCTALAGSRRPRPTHMTTPAYLGAMSMWFTENPPREKPAQASVSVVHSTPAPTERAPARPARGQGEGW